MSDQRPNGMGPGLQSAPADRVLRLLIESEARIENPRMPQRCLESKLSQWEG